MGTLYLIPTPIGNLEDITLRALRLLKAVALIAAEDTRTSHILMKHYNITTPLTSYHEHNKLTKLDAILTTLQTSDVALISDAGTPAISDPGYELVRAVLDAGYRVEPLPGANAVLPALIASGLPTDSFLFLGFFPRKASAQTALLNDITKLRHTLIFYENPYRVVETLRVIYAGLGNRQGCVAREISKLYEEFVRGDLLTLIATFEETAPRGEVALVIAGASDAPVEKWTEAQVRAEIEKRRAEGESLKTISRDLAEVCGWQKRDIYALGIGD